MTPLTLTDETLKFMTDTALFYQQSIIRALAIQVRKHGIERQFPLSQALARIMGWRQRYQSASETERHTFSMWLDWLENVHAPADVYTDWSIAYCETKWMNERIAQAERLERSAS